MNLKLKSKYKVPVHDIIYLLPKGKKEKIKDV